MTPWALDTVNLSIWLEPHATEINLMNGNPGVEFGKNLSVSILSYHLVSEMMESPKMY